MCKYIINFPEGSARKDKLYVRIDGIIDVDFYVTTASSYSSSLAVEYTARTGRTYSMEWPGNIYITVIG